MKRIISILLSVCMLALLCSCGKKSEENSNNETPATHGATQKLDLSSSIDSEIFGNFDAKNIYGEDIDEDYIRENKITMVNIWGTFCTPCLEEMPYIEELYQRYSSEGFSVLGIVIDTVDSNYSEKEEKVSEAKRIVEELGLSYENIIPNKKLFEGELGTNQFIPVTYFVNSSGVTLTQKYVGKRSESDWEEIIKSLLEEQ